MATYLSQSTQSLNISESFQASLSAVHQQQEKKRLKNKSLKTSDVEQGRHDQNWDDEETAALQKKKSSKQDGGGSISVCRQFMLVMAFVGVEFSAAFTIIYGVLFLQFLGVPTSLLSVGGVICGSSAFVLLPIIGWFSDRGSNPVTRKIGMMAIGYSVYALGYSGLIFCAVLKLYPAKSFHPNVTSGAVVINDLHLQNHVDATENIFPSTTAIAMSSERSFFTTKSVPVPDGRSVLEPSSRVANTNRVTNNATTFIIDKGDHLSVGEPNENDDGVVVSMFIPIIGIIGIAFLDLGFDCCVSLCRAFVLECTPPSLHSRLLVMATAFGASASCLVGFVGTFNIPGALGPMFGVDGTPATIIVFSCAIFISLSSCFACTLTTGYTLMMRKKKKKKTTTVSEDDDNNEDDSVDSDSDDENGSNNNYYNDKNRIKGSRQIMNSFNSSHHNSFRKSLSLSKNSLTKVSTESIFHRSNPSEPLLPTTAAMNKQNKTSHHNHYQSTGTSSRLMEVQNPVDKIYTQLHHRLTEDESNILHENKILDVTFQRQNNNNDDDDDDHRVEDYDDDETPQPNNVENSGEREHNDSLSMSKSYSEDEQQRHQYSGSVHEERSKGTTAISSFFDTVLNSYSFSMSIMQSNLGTENNNDHRNNIRIDKELPLPLPPIRNDQGLDLNTAVNPPKPIWRNRRLMILCVSMFFTMGAMLSFSLYAGTVLTIGIYHGDPLAMLGSKGRDLYDIGLRKAALANLICFLTYSATSVFMKKIITLIGEEAMYMVCQLGYFAGYTSLLFIQTEEVFFLTITISGFYRACCFTLGYILANKFVQEEERRPNPTTGTGSGRGIQPPPAAAVAGTSSSSRSTSKNIGQVMVLIGMMLPCSYLLLSTIFGPLMDATDSAFVPVAVGSICTGSSFLVFCLLFLVRK